MVVRILVFVTMVLAPGVMSAAQGQADLVKPNRTGFRSLPDRDAPPPKNASSDRTDHAGAGRAPRSQADRPQDARGTNAAPEARPDPDAWESWWDGERDALVGSCRSSPARTQPVDAKPGRDADPVITKSLLPALLAAMQSPQDTIAVAATLAVGRVAGPDHDYLVREPLRSQLARSETSVRKAALIALGLLGDERAAADIEAVLVRSSRTSERAAAAIGRGLLGDADARFVLAATFARTEFDERELRVGALVGLASVVREPLPVVAQLVTILRDARLDRAVRAEVPRLLARLRLAHAAVPMLLECVVHGAGADLVAASIHALGKLASFDQRSVIGSLLHVARNDADRHVRHLALVALAEIAARDPLCDHHASEHDALADTLLETLAQTGERAWGALAVGLHARGIASVRARATDRLRAALVTSVNPSEQAALALGLGLAGATQATPQLLCLLRDANVPSLRGHVALALGLMRDQSVAPFLRREIEATAQDRRALMNLTRGLALLADQPTVSLLIDHLINATSQDVSTYALALGTFGDRTGIEPLRALLADPTSSAPDRAVAATALGMLAARPGVETILATLPKGSIDA